MQLKRMSVSSGNVVLGINFYFMSQAEEYPLNIVASHSCTEDNSIQQKGKEYEKRMRYQKYIQIFACRHSVIVIASLAQLGEAIPINLSAKLYRGLLRYSE